jgi:hypothetical protein
VNLEHISSFSVTRSVLLSTEKELLEAGDNGFELFVLWSGKSGSDETFEITTHHVPEQESFKTSEGLLVRVSGPALHRLNSMLYETGERLAAQVHAHPTSAFHSHTDNSYPIVTALGGLSIVVPDFATRGVFTRGTAGYRLTNSGWTKISKRRLSRMLRVVEG